MLDSVGNVLQVVATWSQLIGLVTAPVALILLVVAFVNERARSSAAQWTLILSWPWAVYLWAIGIGVSLSAWGWFGLGILLVAAVFLGAKAASVGIVAAFVGGATQLALMLLAVAVVLFAVQLAATVLLAKASAAAATRSGEST